ncbi:MAG: DUF4440 domain-containing protein [Gammaproteobacteria bacterium]|nr:DUF4440 domain-containing protein [Gammaproteobacteria bacterium]
MIYQQIKMKFLAFMAMTLMLILSQSALAGTSQQCKMDIKVLLKSYEQALNNSDVNNVMKLYAADGVFMPSGKPTSKGQTQVRAAYQHVFEDLDLDIAFHIDEIERHGDLAFVRTFSDGSIKLLKKNMDIKNHTRELFVMKRINDDWKIYRYMFNKMSTPGN